MNRTIARYAGDAAGNRLLVVAVEGDALFEPATLAGFSAALEAVAALPGVTGVVTPFNLPTFQRAADGRLQVVTLAPERVAPADAAGIAAFRSRLAATRYARNLVASADGTLLAAFAQVAPDADAAGPDGRGAVGPAGGGAARGDRPGDRPPGPRRAHGVLPRRAT